MNAELAWSSKLRPEVVGRWEELIQLRREFHKYPELSWKETQTAERIRNWLQREGISEVKSVAETGVVALIRGGQPGPTIMYRADIDGLPIVEDSGVEFASVNDGIMHACGHDGHTAVALMLASLLHQRRHQLHGNVKVVFQPAEEGGAGGAAAMIAQGVLENPHVDAALGLHIAGLLPPGVLGITPGPTTAAVDNFEVTILGKGGHAAYPHLTVDPIMVGAQLVSALQTLVSRNVDPTKAVVVTVGTFHGGSKRNIIPDSVEITGTIRGYDMELMEQIPQRMETMLRGITEAMGASFRFHHHLDNPSVVNDLAFSHRVQRHAVDLVGPQSMQEYAITAADDMSRFLQRVPGCYFFLGAADAIKGPQTHHQARFVFDDRCLALGLELGLRVIEEYLVG